MTGKISSLQSLGAADGPGVRYIVFLKGCPLRCVYCHNPETWHSDNLLEMTENEVFEKVKRCKPYFGENGGITVSGGEPLLQGEFVGKLFSLAKSESIHTALDTSGIGADKNTKELLKATDLVICDIKFSTEELYKAYSGGSLYEVLSFIKMTEQANIPLWVRHVVVPGITDSENEVNEVIRLATGFKNLKKIELLPFKRLCLTKYEALGLNFPLENTPECDENTLKKLSQHIPDKFK